MSAAETIATVEDLLVIPRVRAAKLIELCICDVVHFRLVSPLPVFQLVEARLCQRDAVLYKGFAEARVAVEQAQRGSPIRDKIDACCVNRGEWIDNRQILFSTELEVWMDISYPNPWALDLYHQALKAGVSIFVPQQGPFTELFHKLLLQKNGFERVVESSKDRPSVPVFIGEQISIPPESVHLAPPPILGRTHSFAGEESFSAAMANGVVVRHRENLTARGIDDLHAQYRELGYRLIGPTALLLIQSLHGTSVPVAFSGMGSGFLTTLCQSLKHPWPWMPDITSPEKAEFRFSLFPGKSVSQSLMPSMEEDLPSLLEKHDFAPAHLLLPAVENFIKSALRGPMAGVIQANAAEFILDYARLTRGLYQPVSVETVMREWKQTLLLPEESYLEAFAAGGALPGFKKPGVFARNVKAIKAGSWPTGTWSLAGPVKRAWMQLCAPERTKSIRKSMKDLQSKD